MTLSLHGNSIIAGDVANGTGVSFTSVNARTKETGTVDFKNASVTDIDAAAVAATEAYRETRNYAASRLADFLDNVADNIEALGETLLETTDMETGLGIPRLTGERGRTTGQLRKFAALLREGSYVEAIIDTADPDRQPLPKPDVRRMLLPIGPVAVFAASNFPYAFSVAGGDTASAWAAGCPVILKAHPGHPATSEMVANAINDAIQAQDFPSGFFSLIQGDQIDVGQNLVKHPDITAVGFTGSLRAGRAIYDTAAARPTPIPVYAEMGSVNPMVLLPGALQDRGDAIATGLTNSVTLGSGQFCTNPGLVFVVKSEITDQFIQQFTAAMREKQPGVLLNAQIESGLTRAVAGTVQNDAVQTLTGADPVATESFCYPHTVLTTTSQTFREDESLQTEHFGPVTLFVQCASVDDLLATLSSVEGNLTGTIHAAPPEMELAGQVCDILRERVGRLIWNGYPTGVEVNQAMQHGGPYPATTAPGTTSVGMTAIKRFLRPVAYQDVPDDLLPDALKDANPLGILRLVDDSYTHDAISE